jgi:hypothetical protein
MALWTLVFSRIFPNVHERGYEVDAPKQRSRHGATAAVNPSDDERVLLCDSSQLARVLGGAGAAKADRAYQQIAAAA